MKIGMLWFDDGDVPLADKIARASAYYRQKYGSEPDTCYVHPGMMGEGGVVTGNVRVSASPVVLMGHLWIGREEQVG